jgi:hypothetical protein
MYGGNGYLCLFGHFSSSITSMINVTATNKIAISSIKLFSEKKNYELRKKKHFKIQNLMVLKVVVTEKKMKTRILTRTLFYLTMIKI